MLAQLIAFGVEGLISDDVEVGTGTVTAGADQTAVLAAQTASGGTTSGLPIDAPVVKKPFDPSDRAPYAIDFTVHLADDETIAELRRITMSASGAAVGVQIDTDPVRPPLIDTGGKKAEAWLIVDDAFQANAAFSGAGIQVGISFLIRTSADPYREYERTIIVVVRQG